MRILLLTTHFNIGGIGIYVLSLAKGLKERGHQVLVATSGGDLVDSLQALGLNHLTIDIKTKSEISPKVFLACRELAQIIKAENIEIIHTHTRVTQVLAHLATKKANIPYISTCHGFFKVRLCRKIFPCWGSRCVAISEAVREHLVNDFKLSEEKISVVHNGVDIEKFFPEKFNSAEKDKFKKDYGLKSQAPIIGTVARLSQVKGQCYLILAMSSIVKEIKEAQLLLVGDGPEKKRLITLTKELGLENSVVFAPSTLDTAVPLSIMDVFVFPSLLEGLGLSIIEAQAMGLPVVASDVGGIYSLVKDGINGFLVHPKDPQAQAAAILKLLKDRQKAFEFATAAREQVKQKFNLHQMVSGIEQVYKEVLKK